jgi:hypothetical protein
MSASTARRSFYEAALSEAEREDLVAARSVEGLEDEIAILRLRLRDALAERPEDIELMERAIRLLVQSLLAEHRLSSKEARGVTDAMTSLIERLAGTLREAVE